MNPSIAVVLSTLFFVSSINAANLPKTSPPSATPISVTAPAKINLNTATAANLIGSIKGIGKKRAEAIIKYRDAHNGFKTLKELASVPGIGTHFVEIHYEQIAQVFTLN